MLQTVSVFSEESLPLPIIGISSPVKLDFNASLGSETVPSWAILRKYNDDYELTEVDVGLINLQSLAAKNMTLSDVRPLWPLNTSTSGDINLGLKLSTVFFKQFYDLQLFRSLYMYSFEVDSPPIDYNHAIRPCTQLQVGIAMEHYSLLNRPSSPCRDDYPKQIKGMMLDSIPADNLNNPIFAPHLPYDRVTCETICLSNHTASSSGCYWDYEAWMYAGMPENPPACEEIWNDMRIGWDVAKCECYKKCTQHTFRVAFENLIDFRSGKQEIFEIPFVLMLLYFQIPFLQLHVRMM